MTARRIGLIGVLVLVLAGVSWLGTRGGASEGAAPREHAGTSGGDPADRHGAVVDSVVFTEQGDPGKAVGQIETGERDVLAQGVTNKTLYRQLRQSERASYDLSYGSSAELTLNPAGPELGNGGFNPFAAKRIREAMNWLVDRQHIANELYGGLAEPRYLPLSTAFPDYARLSAAARELEIEYGHKPAKARRVITEEMQALGAKRVDGVWHYQGKPVTLKLLIRTEDARKQVGDYVANLLADLGFSIERMYRTAEQASPIWISSPPKAGRWHIYTGGWISTVINRDEAQNFANYYTPAGRPFPLWQAYEPSEAFSEVARRLERRDYATWSERRDLMRRALDMAMENSARIWLVDQLNLWARASDVALASDLAGGIAGSRLWPYTLRFRDRVGGQMTISAPNVLTEPWNPVAGTNWIFDQMIINGLRDAPVLPDPNTGLYHPQRIAGAEVAVTEGTPVQRTHDWVTLTQRERITVPDDAWVDWDAEAKRFVTAGERADEEPLTARTRTRIRYETGYLEREWHDGTTMSLADLVLPYILQFVRADEASPLFDASHVPNFKTFDRHFKGWRIVEREPLVVEVYSDQIFPDAESIVAARTPGVTPWHTLALGIRAERSGELAFSSDKADREGVPWLSLVSGPSLAILDRHRREAGEAGWVPFANTLQPYIEPGEAKARYEALGDWRDAHEHYWVSDGPLYLDSLHPIAGTLVLRRDSDFPDTADKWLDRAQAAIPELAIEGPMTVDLDEGARFSIEVTAEGQPYPREAVDRVDYLLLDGRGTVVDRGEATFDEPGRWLITLDAGRIDGLAAGANRLEVTMKSNRVALPRFASHAFATVPGTAEATE